MPTTQITPSGHIAIPTEVLTQLQLKPGDTLNIEVDNNGKIHLELAKIDVRTLSGMLYDPTRSVVSLAEMDTAIADCARESV
ncbi:MAG: AbrB/MazE/SpoVT family DNA-binding domain-containing protein [Spirulinaceae cyanobacterium]